ncbi:MAG: transporter related protein, partial [Cyanobacteria bacterium RYN_339]|nr:transporter related protein [Cyanobacteria bacterium RYN_339]
MTNLLSPELKNLLGTLGAYKGRYALGCLFMACTDAGQLAVPWLVGRVVDGLAAHRLDAAGVSRYAGLIVLAALVVAAGRLGWRAYIFGTARRLDRDLRQRLYEHLQGLSIDFHLRHKVGDLMAHATNDIQAVRAVAGEGVMSGWDAFAMAVGAAGMVISTVDWRLGVVALSPLLLLPVFTYMLGQRLHRSYAEVQGAFALVSDRAQEGFAGIRVVKGFAREGHQLALFAEANEAYRAAYARMSRFEVASDPVVGLLAGVSFAVGLLYGGHMVLTGQLSVGQYVAFNSFLGMIVWPMLAVGWSMNLFQRGAASMGRLQKIFAETPSVADGPLALPTP